MADEFTVKFIARQDTWNKKTDERLGAIDGNIQRILDSVGELQRQVAKLPCDKNMERVDGVKKTCQAEINGLEKRFSFAFRIYCVTILGTAIMVFREQIISIVKFFTKGA